MLLHTHRWGGEGAERVVCVHGLVQNGRVYDGLGRRLAEAGRSVLAVDLRGHGRSGRVPPWNAVTHAADLIETLEQEGVERMTLVGHSFGGLVAVHAAALLGERVERLALLDPGIELPAERALRGAEMDRLDWSFATAEGALNAFMSSETIVSAPRETVAAFVREDVKQGPDGRYRFGFCPSAAVVAWSEMTLPAPISRIPTLLVRATVPLVDPRALLDRYRERLGDLLTETTVPNGHNLLWESPTETIAAIETFLP